MVIHHLHEIGSWDNGSATDVYYGGGWGNAMRPAMKHRFYTNSSYQPFVWIIENGGLTVMDISQYKSTNIFCLSAQGHGP